MACAKRSASEETSAPTLSDGEDNISANGETSSSVLIRPRPKRIRLEVPPSFVPTTAPGNDVEWDDTEDEDCSDGGTSSSESVTLSSDDWSIASEGDSSFEYSGTSSDYVSEDESDGSCSSWEMEDGTDDLPASTDDSSWAMVVAPVHLKGSVSYKGGTMPLPESSEYTVLRAPQGLVDEFVEALMPSDLVSRVRGRFDQPRRASLPGRRT